MIENQNIYGQNNKDEEDSFLGSNPIQEQNYFEGYSVMDEEWNTPKASPKKAGWALGMGITAAILPIPVIDIIFAGVGFILLYLSAKEGYKGGLWQGGLVLNVLGIIRALSFTVQWLIAI